MSKTKRIPESSIDISIEIRDDYIYNLFEFILNVGKNQIVLKRSEYRTEIERIQREFETRTKVKWNEILVTGETK
jgi:hypothetical protein